MRHLKHYLQHHLQPYLQPHLQLHLKQCSAPSIKRCLNKAIAAAFALSAVVLLSGCSSLTPVERLVITQDAGPLLAQIRAGEVGIDDMLPWGGAFGAAPSYFTPLCAAAFVGSVPAMQEMLLLGASVDVECGGSVTPLDLVMRHPSHQKAGLMGDLLRSRGANARLAQDHVARTGVRSPM